jgi:uncharacterized membrane protein
MDPNFFNNFQNPYGNLPQTYQETVEKVNKEFTKIKDNLNRNQENFFKAQNNFANNFPKNFHDTFTMPPPIILQRDHHGSHHMSRETIVIMVAISTIFTLLCLCGIFYCLCKKGRNYTPVVLYDLNNGNNFFRVKNSLEFGNKTQNSCQK